METKFQGEGTVLKATIPQTLVNHIKKKHPEVFREFTEKQQLENQNEKGKYKSLKQTTLLIKNNTYFKNFFTTFTIFY